MDTISEMVIFLDKMAEGWYSQRFSIILDQIKFLIFFSFNKKPGDYQMVKHTLKILQHFLLHF